MNKPRIFVVDKMEDKRSFRNRIVRDWMPEESCDQDQVMTEVWLAYITTREDGMYVYFIVL